MRHQAFRTIALMLGAMFAAAPAAQAGTITYGEMVRTAGAGGQLRPAIDVRLRVATEGQPTAQVAATQSGAAPSQGPQAADQQMVASSGSTNVPAPASSDPTLSQSGGRVETVDIGDVTGTVCDCGEIPPSLLPKAGGFPWWVFGGIPLVCVSGICTGDEDNPVTNPTPTPPCPDCNINPQQTPVPEPMSLLLFGSGLLAVGASARRRYGRRRDEGLNLSATTEEV